MKNKQRGFTLIELLVVVLIIGILSAVALPQYEKAVEKSRAAEAFTLVRAIADAEERFFLANGTYSEDITLLDLGFPNVSANGYKSGIPGFQAKYFWCRATMADIPSYWKALAVCNRDPHSSLYSIGKLKNGKLVCGYYSDKGKKFCEGLPVDVVGSNAEILAL